MADVVRLSSALAGSYRVERELGKGGMATVYLALDQKHQRRVALKVLHPDLAHAVGPERFRREIEIAARLQHPHILTVFDSGEADGMLWYTMPFVEGESLRDLLSRERELPIETALQITREVAEALDYAHAQGVIHRDIKPENVLLSLGHALVADFGIARAMHEETDRLTMTGLAIGTPAYMSPEQSVGERAISPQSDLYSLACVTFEMLTGEPPYTGASARAIMTKRMTDAVPSPRRLRQAIPASVDRAVMRALAPTPADRFGSSGEFSRALTIDRGAPARARLSWPRVTLFAGLALVPLAALLWATWPTRTGMSAVSQHILRGDSLLARRTAAAFGNAMQEYRTALALDPGNAAALAKIGYTYTLFVDWGWQYEGLAAAELRSRAMDFSERALAADSTSAEAWLTRAFILAAGDPYRMRGAVDAFTRALSLDSTTAEGWYQFGQALMVLGEDARAAAAYRRAFALDPNRPMALMSLSAMSLQAGRVEEARGLIDSAVAASRIVTSPYVRMVRGRLALRSGDLRAAHDEADLALAMDTTNTTPARSLLASVYWAEGDKARAAAELARLLEELGPGNPSPTTARYVASALVAQGRTQDAIALFERARPRGAQLWFYMQSLEFHPLRADPRFKRVNDEADPRVGR